MAICRIEDITFSYPKYSNPNELIGWANHGKIQAGEIKAEYTPRFGGSINMYRLVTYTDYRSIGIAFEFLDKLTIWGHSLGAIEIICAIIPDQLVADTTTHYDKYLVKQGFEHHGLLLKKNI